MKNGQCPKCGADQVYRGSQSPLQAGEGLAHLAAYARNTGVNILLDAYLCANCGYVELYAAEQSRAKLWALAEDPKHWQKVQATLQ